MESVRKTFKVYLQNERISSLYNFCQKLIEIMEKQKNIDFSISDDCLI